MMIFICNVIYFKRASRVVLTYNAFQKQLTALLNAIWYYPVQHFRFCLEDKK